MASESRSGRPRASSREVLSEAACELFLEQGYDSTSVSDITQRAGVSRSSFFNYFSAKSDVLWSGFDGRVDEAIAALTESDASPTEALVSIGRDFAPDALALAIANADVMGLAAELDRDRAQRQFRLQREVAARLVSEGEERLRAQVRGGAVAAAVLAAVWAWAEHTAGGPALADLLATALADARA
ncbi:TetR/AcrR family transcriptional regulator [Microbacterium sp. Bi128]|uniref:TetR/AcrR family transcriptional regulator n=1 Tax=Microbacterium sp. Bi128 TaxID=2821115 RepID=UPI001D6C2984|nr:TetR/AcrR family transcriptional regulator [Microbacterium sp. Bi128]CAH0171500.1 Putative mycofactocin biosynthesis transcriptional regulator MftR [Microbacterium sp. Bi128]